MCDATGMQCVVCGVVWCNVCHCVCEGVALRRGGVVGSVRGTILGGT